MRSSLFADRLAPRGVDVVVPGDDDQERVHAVVYDELTRGIVTEQARDDYLAIIDKLVADGAEAVLLACTEQDELLQDGDASVPLISTTQVHCKALVDFMLGETT
jgi:aspartate racemase